MRLSYELPLCRLVLLGNLWFGPIFSLFLLRRIIMKHISGTPKGFPLFTALAHIFTQTFEEAFQLQNQSLASVFRWYSHHLDSWSGYFSRVPRTSQWSTLRCKIHNGDWIQQPLPSLDVLLPCLSNGDLGHSVYQNLGTWIDLFQLLLLRLIQFHP